MSAAPSSPSDDSPDAQAAAWLALREAGWTPAEARAYAEWLCADPRHEAAAARLESTHQLLGQLPAALSPDLLAELDALEPRDHVSRFPQWTRWAAVAAALLVLASVIHWAPSRPEDYTAQYVTAPDAHQSIALPDGSEIVLARSSALSVHYTTGERKLRLDLGEGRFSVAKDADRPFVVAAGKVSVRAIGTIFDVRHHAGAVVEVVVTEGVVQVVPLGSAGAADPPLLLAAGQSGQWNESRHLDVVADGLAVDSPQAPLVPRLTFSNTPLLEAVTSFNLHSPVKLELGDAELSSRAVGGQFSADAGEAFALLLTANGDIRLERPSPDRIILRRAD